MQIQILRINMATLVGKWIRKGARALSVLPGPLGLAGRAVNMITTIKDAKKAGATPSQAFQVASTGDASIVGTQSNAGGGVTSSPFDADFLGIGKNKKEEEEKKKRNQMLMIGGGVLALATILILALRKPSPQSSRKY